MPYATNGQIKIYYETEGQGPPILLAHGSTGSTSFWRGYGYVDQLKHRFTVILYDTLVATAGATNLTKRQPTATN